MVRAESCPHRNLGVTVNVIAPSSANKVASWACVRFTVVLAKLCSPPSLTNKFWVSSPSAAKVKYSEEEPKSEIVETR